MNRTNMSSSCCPQVWVAREESREWGMPLFYVASRQLLFIFGRSASTAALGAALPDWEFPDFPSLLASCSF